MSPLSATSLMISAFLLISCAKTPTTNPGSTDAPASEASADPEFGPKCIQRIKAGLANPKTSEIALSGEGDRLQAKVTTTNPDDGTKSFMTYVCERDAERAVTAKLIAN